MTIYLDIVLLENLIMNYIILFATGIIIKQKVKHIKLILAGLLGGIYAVIDYMKILEIYSNLFFKILLSVTMIYLSFNAKNLKILIKQLLIFYLTSFAFGGCAFALLYFLKPENIFMRNGIYIGTYPIKVAILGGFVGFVIITTAFQIIKRQISKKDMYCDIIITFKENESKVKAFIDTGNMLKEPITGIPVIVVEKEELSALLPQYLLENIEKVLSGEYEEVLSAMEKEEYISRFRFIPFSSLGQEHGMLLGFKADYIKLEYEEMEKRINNCLIGVYPKKLSAKKAYHALIGLDILENNEEAREYESVTNLKI